MATVRLHQFLSKSGAFATKASILQALEEGKITVDGKTIHSPHFHLSSKQLVKLNGRTLRIQKEQTTVILNKPAGYICAKLAGKEKKDKVSIFDVLEKYDWYAKIKPRLQCVGRLDEDTCGLLVLTTDGDLHNKLLTEHVPKQYRVQIDRIATDNDVKKLKEGITIKIPKEDEFIDYVAIPLAVSAKGRELYITIDEGKKRQIRQMIQKIGAVCIHLERTHIGKLSLQETNLKQGEALIADEKIMNKLITQKNN